MGRSDLVFRAFRFAAVCVSLACCHAVSATAQVLDLDLVDFDASGYRTVTGTVRATADGFPIRNLSARNFTVRENGVPMTTLITACEDSAAARPVSVLLVIDRSGSMRDALPAARNAAIGFVARLTPADEGALVSFTENTYVDQNWTRDYTLLRNRIANLQVPLFGGGTALWDAIERGTSVHATSVNRKVMIVLTDGQDRNSRLTYNDALAAVLGRGVLVYTIGLGNDIEVPLLTALAQATGGRYYAAPTTDDLDRIYQEISTQLTTTGICRLTWESQLDCLDGSDVTVEIELDALGTRTMTYAVYQRPVDSTTLSFVSLAVERTHVVDAGQEITIPVRLTRVSSNRAPDRFDVTVTYDQSLLQLLRADTTALTRGYTVLPQPVAGGTRIRLAGSRSITTTGDLVLLTFKAADSFDSRKVEVLISRPDVGQTCTFPSAEAGLISISGRCERAVIRDHGTRPAALLHPPSPNPFNPSTRIRFELSAPQRTSLRVYDALGREVRTLVDDLLPAGTHELRLDAGVLAAGAYYAVLRSGADVVMRELMLVK